MKWCKCFLWLYRLCSTIFASENLIGAYLNVGLSWLLFNYIAPSPPMQDVHASN
ncbi:hypothetical protein ACJW30_10G145200 [Castanea mollissima]